MTSRPVPAASRRSCTASPPAARRSVVVYAPAWKGAAEFDARQPFPVVRHPGSLMLPEPGVLRRAADVLRAERCDSVVFGAAAPLGLLAPALRRRGADRLVGITHGHEAGWASLPVARRLLRRIGGEVDVLTYLGEYTRSRMARALTPAAAARMSRLAPGVDEKVFHRNTGGDEIRARHGLTDRPVAVCVSRLVPRKGQDALIHACPASSGGSRTPRSCSSAAAPTGRTWSASPRPSACGTPSSSPVA